ncbi:MAG TPA: hypothetical protein VL523_04645 [Terriglobia bacterium]|nr:hypothetical protein [Terriglobia bacterium]
MDPGLWIPLGGMAAVVLIVAMVQFAGVRDREVETRARLSQAEVEHRTRLAELDEQLRRLRQGD